MTRILLLSGLAFILAACNSLPEPSARSTTVSDELISYFAPAEYILVCRKQKMQLIVTDVLRGPQKRGDIFATYSRSDSPAFAIDPAETWTDLAVMLPNQSRLAYYRIDQQGYINWFDAEDPRHRKVLLKDLKKAL